MKAHLHSARIAPKKANLIAKMVRGMPVPVAVEALRRTNKKAARMVEQLLRSAMANASFNLKQDPQTLVLKKIVVNQGQAYRRGVPMARGRTRPIKKFLSHIDLELGFAETERTEGTEKTEKTSKQRKAQAGASQNAKNDVQKSAKVSHKKEANEKKSSSPSS